MYAIYIIDHIDHLLNEFNCEFLLIIVTKWCIILE